MVSIFADNLYEETTTLTFQDGTDINDSSLDANLTSVTNTDVTNGFAYLDTINVVLQPTTLDVDLSASFSDFTIDLDILLQFNGVTLVSINERIARGFDDYSDQDSGNQTVNISLDKQLTADVYIDEPLDISTQIVTSGRENKISINGTQNIDFDLSIQGVGRLP